MIGVWKNLNNKSLSEKYNRVKLITAIGNRIGITPENENVMKKVAIRYA